MNLYASLKTMCTTLALTAIFIGTQSFVQDDTTIAAQKSSVKMTTVADSSNTPNKAEAVKISINVKAQEEADREVYDRFFEQFGKISFTSFANADEEALNNFENGTKINLNLASETLAAADEAALRNFEDAQPRVFISFSPVVSDAEIISRFEKENAPRITLEALTAESIRKTDEEVLKLFNSQYQSDKLVKKK